MITDPRTLPLLKWEPDWSKPVKLSLISPTLIERSEGGAELRSGLATVLRKRVSFNISTDTISEARGLEMFLRSNQSNKIAIPIWSEAVRVTSDLNAVAVGSLKINLTPFFAVNAGAQWRLKGGAWTNSGTTLTNLPPGDYWVFCKPVIWWTTPAPLLVTVVEGETTEVSAGYAVPIVSRAEMTSHPDGSVLNGAVVTFNWSSGVGVTEYALWIGNAAGTYDIYASSVSGTSQTVTLPSDGRTLYVRLLSKIGGVWYNVDYIYTAASSSLARLTSHANLATLTGYSTTFTWSAGTGVNTYALWIGSAVGTYDIAAVSVSGLSQMVELPVDGRKLYVRLWTITGGTLRYNDYVFTAWTAAAAQLTSPANNATLSASTTFQWSAGTNVTDYALWIGSSPGTYDVAAIGNAGQSQTVTIPADGRALFVRVWSKISGVWYWNSYTFTAPKPPIAAITAPTSGSTLTSASVAFTWSAGTGVTSYAIWVGSSAGTYDLYAIHESGLSRTLTLPVDGRAIHVRLWSLVSGVWFYNDYAYTAFAATPARITAPESGIMIEGPVTFEWDSGSDVTAYALWVGSAPGTYDVHASSETGNSKEVTLPSDGRKLYVRLWSMVSGAWMFRDYAYTAYSELKTIIPVTSTAGRLMGGGWVVVWESADNYEVAPIYFISDNAIVLSAELVGTFPAGSLVIPLGVFLMSQGAMLSQFHAADRVLVPIEAEECGDECLDEITPSTKPSYAGEKLFPFRINWDGDLKTENEIVHSRVSSSGGVVTPVITELHPRQRQTVKVWLDDRGDISELLGLVAHVQGRSRKFWMHSHKADFELDGTFAGGTHLPINKNGFSGSQDFWGKTRRFLLVEDAGLWFMREIVDVEISLDGDEVLILDAALPELSAGALLSLAWLARLDTNDVTLEFRHTESADVELAIIDLPHETADIVGETGGASGIASERRLMEIEGS